MRALRRRALAAVLIAALSGCTGADKDTGEPLAPPVQDMGMTSLEALLTRPQQAGDIPPGTDTATEPTMDWGTSRALGSAGGNSWWVIRTSDDQICLLAASAGDLGFASGCTASEQFEAGGIGIGVGGADATNAASELRLVPDGYALTEGDRTSWVPLSSNVLVPRTT